ncbi:benzoate/H(+) symporter BenE family transporter [Stutzerimonas tarimensis]|uniref:Benzoate/H(+) symporter BenE family transporter n=1 Tax=Stutzerimonas tarimensis TaxID=1507735 RepID=A0ABV7T761_9GAMM
MTSHATLRPLADSSPSTLIAGFVAMLTAYTSSLVLMFQAGQGAGLSSGQIASWIWSLSIGMALCSVLLSLRYRAPIVVAWSTPGAALLISSLPTVPYGEAIGAFIATSVLIVVCGITGSFERIMRVIPPSLAAALLAGILFRIGLEICRAMEIQPLLVFGMFITYLLARRWAARYAVLAALSLGSMLAYSQGLVDFSGVSLELATPVWTTPAFSVAAMISIGLPLFVVAIASQNMPGLAVLRAEGYQAPASPLLTVTGLASIVLAPFGSHGVHLAAITMAICSGPQAHPDPARRYTAAMWCGLLCGVVGLFGATLAALFAAFPQALVLSIAALALLGSISAGLTQAMSEPSEREAALVTFLVTASGLTLWNIGSAVWALVAGLLTLLICRRRPR